MAINTHNTHHPNLPWVAGHTDWLGDSGTLTCYVTGPSILSYSVISPKQRIETCTFTYTQPNKWLHDLRDEYLGDQRPKTYDILGKLLSI